MGKTEGVGGKQIVSPRQTQGRGEELIECASETQEAEETEQCLAKEVAMIFKVMTSPLVEPLGAEGHNTTLSLPESEVACCLSSPFF